jgi:prepilin-type N-terminal cleavage/methylation domain-containing protein
MKAVVRAGKPMKRAFTLIELLVVIAIIAILAAILFPVFAQAKEAAKRTAALSQAKQAGTAILIYQADYDDQYPGGLVPNATTVAEDYRLGDFTPQTPQGWRLPADPVAQEEHGHIWVNATEPYRKNYDMMNPGGMNTVNISGWDYNNVARAPKGVNFSYNGLLQYMSQTEVVEQSKLTLIWQGFGNTTNRGAAFLSPRLNCNDPAGGPCRYNPSGRPQTNATGNPQIFGFNFNTDYTVYGSGQIHVFADSSAKLVNYGQGNRASFPASTNSQVVWQFLDTNGRIPSSPGAFFRGMGGLRGANYAAAFCPDNSFAN